MRSVGPFRLTEAEFVGLEALLLEDEKKHRTRAEFADRLVAKFCDPLANPATFLQSEASVFEKDRLNQTRQKVELETGESGETAEVEEKSRIIGRVGATKNGRQLSCSELSPLG